MSRIELKITHSNGGRSLGHFRVTSKNEVITIGSSKNARIRVRNSNVDSIHASIENRDGVWKLIDLASSNGTWIGKDQVIESNITGKTRISFGDDSLTIEPIEVADYNLFQKNQPLSKSSGSNIIEKQQLVVLRGSEILSSKLINRNETIKLYFDRKAHTFKPASGLDWIEDKIGEITVRRRLVQTEVYENERPKSWIGYFPKELVESFGIAIAITIFFFLSAWLMPKLMPKDPGALEKNKYTRMIYDKEIILKQQEKATEIKKQAEKKKKEQEPKKKVTVVKEKPPEKKRPTVMPKTEEAKRVVTQLRDSGLSKQIANIASTNINTKGLMDGAGKGVGQSRNRSFASAGVAVKGARLSKNAGTHNVTAVATNGVAGGTAVSGKLGGLSAGGVGGGGVVEAIEEETDISGGLDPAIIAKVVKDNIGRVRYCYERQLAAHPDLYGKIKIAWTINAGGSVTTQKIEQTTMNNAMVEGCILRQVSKWNFPRPDGGGDVVVAYPFFFKANK